MKAKLLAAAVIIGTAMTLTTGGALMNRADGQVVPPVSATQKVELLKPIVKQPAANASETTSSNTPHWLLSMAGLSLQPVILDQFVLLRGRQRPGPFQLPQQRGKPAPRHQSGTQRAEMASQAAAVPGGRPQPDA